ncbi:uncharacterized protein MELLADRAFT_58965 [Melampsora larici-populina 98AG31]|uniref:Uncharacterized protein n=1 Tax=Melampsora larici-populina (strain 98AG31 / pathotype 3-4-7) TaxID=747676 RepID=F4R6K4_MELLP|nr:uncharacterized protein MELLADRAFT_58965 [Melampsora larici-populina 98AG31]EGG12449.1 hypothetical protein MELLADRAFT_58965 [Melampsora larici-populina 98AG31]
MKLIRIKSSLSYFKKCATKAKTWLAVAANKFHRSRDGFDPSVSIGLSSTSPPHTSSFSSATSFAHPSTPITYISIDTSSLVTPTYLPFSSVYGLPVTSHTSLPLLAPTSGPPSTPISPTSVESSPPSTQFSPMSIYSGPLVTPTFRGYYNHFNEDSPPLSTPARFTTIESSQVSTDVTPQDASGEQNWIQLAREIHRRSPTPSCPRQALPAHESSPPTQQICSTSDQLYLISPSASTSTCSTTITSSEVSSEITPEITPRTPQPYAHCASNQSPQLTRKRCFSVIMDDDDSVPPYKRNRLALPGPVTLDNSCQTLVLSARKRRFAISMDDEDTEHPHKRYKFGSSACIFLADGFPPPYTSRDRNGWFLNEHKGQIFWAAYPSSAPFTLIVNDSNT